MPKISDLPTDTAPASTDLIPFVDVDAARTESVTVANLAASSAFTSQFPVRPTVDGVAGEVLAITSLSPLVTEWVAAGAAAGVDTSGTPVANDFARFTDADTIEGRSYSEVRADLDLEPGVDVMALNTAPVVVSGTTDTLASTDNGKVNRYTNAALVTVTIPTDGSDDLVDGFWATLVAEGAAGLTLSTSGVTVTGSALTTIAQGEALVVIKTATANTWVVLGGTS